MVYTLELCKMDDSLGLIFPPEILRHLGVGEGDEVTITFSNGAFHLRANRDNAGKVP
jgi:antitoxin component of MazEF toxin-antitoxin module